MYFHHSLIPRGAYFLLPLESKQEATSGWNFTKCISEVKVNQLKVKNLHVRMGISTFNTFVLYYFPAQKMPLQMDRLVTSDCSIHKKGCMLFHAILEVYFQACFAIFTTWIYNYIIKTWQTNIFVYRHRMIRFVPNQFVYILKTLIISEWVIEIDYWKVINKNRYHYIL